MPASNLSPRSASVTAKQSALGLASDSVGGLFLLPLCHTTFAKLTHADLHNAFLERLSAIPFIAYPNNR
jgi:hypothetical protein